MEPILETLNLDDCLVLLARNENAELATQRLSTGGVEAVNLLLDVLEGRRPLKIEKPQRDTIERFLWALTLAGKVDVVPLLDAIWEGHSGISLQWSLGQVGAGLNVAQLIRAAGGDIEARKWCIKQARLVLADPSWLISQPMEQRTLAKSAAHYILNKFDEVW